MNELIKNNLKELKLTLKELSKHFPRSQKAWDSLENQLIHSCNNVLTTIEALNSFTNSFKEEINNLDKENVDLIKNIESNFFEYINSSNENFYNNSQKLTKDLNEEHQKIIAEFKNIQEKDRNYHLSINDQINKLKLISKKEKELLDDDVIQQKRHFSGRINSIYRFKETEAERITNKFHEAIKDYHQKNKQRLTQNIIRQTELSEELKNYLTFHEKDAIYNKQNYLKNLTVLNNKINEVSQTYKIKEDNLEVIITKTDEAYNDQLKKEKEKLLLLNEEVLNEYEQAYKEIDENLDTSRQNFSLKEQELEKRYHRQVTTINVEFQKRKDLITRRIDFVENLKETTEFNEKTHTKELKELNKKLKVLEHNTNKSLIKAKKDYTNKLLSEAKIHVKEYETLSHKRIIIEQVKNDSIELNQTFYSIEESIIKNLNNSSQEINKIKKQIIDNYKLLEMVPLESQTTLSKHIYDLELSYQNLETNHINYITERDKELIDLKSLLHEHNLNKAKSRITLRYDSELEISNMSTYLQMESEKNELVHIKRMLVLKKKLIEANTDQKILRLIQKRERNDFYSSYDNEKLNLTLKYKTNLKNLNDNYLVELNNYSLNNNELNKQHLINTNNSNNNSLKINKESILMKNILTNYYEALKQLFNCENSIYEILLNETSSNTNPDDLLNLLKIITSMLKTKQKTILATLNIFIGFFHEHINSKIENYKVTNYDQKLKEIKDDYNKKEAIIVNNKSLLEENYENTTSSISMLKERIVKLTSELELAFQTIKHSEKELKKKNISNKLKLELNEITKMHEKLIITNNAEIINLKKQITEFSVSLKPLKNEIKTFDRELNHIKKEKRQLINKLEKSTVKNSLIYEENLIKLDSFNNSIILMDNSYNTFLDSLLDSFNSVDNALSSLKTNISLKQKNLSIFFDKSNELTPKEYENEINSLKDNENKNNKIFDKESSYLKKRHEKRTVEIQQMINTLNNKFNKDFRLLDKKYKKDLKTLLISQKEKRLEHSLYIQNVKKEISDFIILHKDLTEAANLNKHELINTNKEQLKNELRLSLKTQNKKIKNTKQHIKRLELDILHENKRHEAKLDYFANNDKDERKAILTKQNNKKTKFIKDIEKLKINIPLLEDEAKRFKLKALEKKVLERKEFNPLKKVDSFKNRFNLRLSIRAKTKQFQHDLLKEI